MNRLPDSLPGRTARAVTLGLAAVLISAACSAAPATPGSANEIVTTDLAGQEVRLSAPANRVVAIPIPAASMLVAINGGPEVLAGMNPSAKQALEEGYLGQVYPELAEIPSDVTTRDFAPIMENLLKVDPDLVIQWGDRGAGLVDPLLDSGMTVAQLQYGTQEYLEQAASLYGTLLGKEDRADELISRMHAGVDSYTDLQDTPSEQRPRVLHLSAVKDGLKVAGASSYNNFVIDLVGGVNPAAGLRETAAAVDLEQVLAWDPEVIFLGNFDPTMPADLYADERWSSITAVREHRVYRVPLGGYRWDPPSQESPLMWEWTAGLVNDAAVPATLVASIRSHYEFLYGQSPSDDQIRTILFGSENAASVGYDAFTG